MTKSERARELFLSGYNCSQSVFGAFCEELGMDFETAVRLASPFGGGMGRMREVCGAVSGMLMAAGMKYGYSTPKDFDEKAELYGKVRELCGEFKERHGSIVCRELLGIGDKKESHIPEKRTAEYYKKRPCPDIIADAAGILEKYIAEHDDMNRA